MPDPGHHTRRPSGVDLLVERLPHSIEHADTVRRTADNPWPLLVVPTLSAVGLVIAR